MSSDTSKPHAVRIRGAEGHNAGCVNGLYELTDEVSGGMPVYKQQGHHVWLEYHVSGGRWKSRPTTHKGQSCVSCYAYVACDFGVLPDKAPTSAWHVSPNYDFPSDVYVAQASVVVTSMSAAELAALKTSCAAARAAATYVVRIRGATGDNAVDVNGLYELSCGYVSGGMPFYKKKVPKKGYKQWLEYVVSDGTWMSKPEALTGQGINLCTAYVACDVGTLPDKAPRGAWHVLVNGAFEAQASVVVTSMSTAEVDVEEEALRAALAAARAATRAATRAVAKPAFIEANRAYQATRAYSTPPVFPELDERHTTNDYGLVHLAMTITKRPIFLAIIHFLLPSEAVFVLQCRKVLVVQVDQAAEAEVHRHLQALEHSRAAFNFPLLASNLRYLHYLQQLTEALVGRPPKGFRFAVTNAASARNPYGVDYDIYNAARNNDLVELLEFCQQWAGHPVIDAYKNEMGDNALFIAARHKHEECIRVLVAANADAAYANSLENDWTVLHYAARHGRASICLLLVEVGASLTAVDRYGLTPLELAKVSGKAECVAILEAAGAVLPPAVVAAYAFVEEHIATTRGFRFAVTKAAYEKAPDGLDKQIYDAAKGGKLDELLGLCQQWAGHPVIDAYIDTNSDRRNALIIAAYNGYEACIRVLIAAKANMGYNYCGTALHTAVFSGHASTCRVLVNEGASLKARGFEGRKPLELAKAAAKYECMAILEEAEAVVCAVQ